MKKNEFLHKICTLRAQKSRSTRTCKRKKLNLTVDTTLRINNKKLITIVNVFNILKHTVSLLLHFHCSDSTVIMEN